MSNSVDSESLLNVNHEIEAIKQNVQSLIAGIEENITKRENSSDPPKPNCESVKPDLTSANIPNSNPPSSNHAGYSDASRKPETVNANHVQSEYSPRVHHQERSSRSHLKVGNKVVESRNRRRSFAGESSLERERSVPIDQGTGKTENTGSTSKIFDESVKYGTNNYDGTSIPYERRTGSMGRREFYGEGRRRYREQNYNGDSPVLRRNVSYGSNMESYGVYDPRSCERMPRRDLQDGLRNRQNYDHSQDPGGVRRDFYQELVRRGYERSQSVTRLGFTEDSRSGYEAFAQTGGFVRPTGYERYSEAAPSGARESGPPPYYAPPRPALRFDLPTRYPAPPQQNYPASPETRASLYHLRDCLKVTKLREHWEETNSKVVQRKSVLDEMMVDSERFESKRQEVEAWLGRMQARREKMGLVGDTADVLEVQLRDQKAYHAELHQYKQQVELFNQLTQKMIALYQDDDTSRIKRTTEQINQRYNNLNSSIVLRGKLLNSALNSLHNFDRSLDKFLAWLSEAESSLECVEVEADRSGGRRDDSQARHFTKQLKVSE